MDEDEGRRRGGGERERGGVEGRGVLGVWFVRFTFLYFALRVIGCFSAVSLMTGA